jgi:hypothetical protein
MASRLDDLLNSVVNRLQSVGVGRTQRQPEQVPYGFRPYEGSQNLATERLVNIGGKTYIGPKEQPPRQDYSGDRYYGLPERNIVQADRPAYTATPMSMSGGLFGSTQGPVTVADTIRGAIPEPLTPEREAELRRMQEKRLPGEEADLRGINLNPDYDNPFFILPERNSSAVADGTVLAGAGRTGELSALDTDYANQTAGNPLKIFEPLFRTTEGYQDRMTDSERRRKADIEAGTSKRRGLFTSTEEAAAAYKRKKARDDLMQYGGSDMPYQGQAADNATRDAILEYGGGEMPYQGQNIEIDPIVLEIPEQPTDEEVIRTLEQDYADLAAAGADTATLSALAREIDSYRDRQSSLPSIVSEAAASDVIENAPVNYDAFGNVISQPETEVLMSRQAQITDPPIEMWNTSYGQLSKQGKWFGGQDAVTKYKADNPTVQLTPAQEYVIANEGYLPDPYYLNKEEKAKGILTQGVGQTKRKGKDYIALGFPATYEDRIADLKRKMGADFVDAVEQNDPEKFKALADLAYRGDIGPLWAGHYKANRLDDAYKEFWKRKKFGGSALDRVAKNSIILFGKGVPKGTKTSDGKKW